MKEKEKTCLTQIKSRNVLLKVMMECLARNLILSYIDHKLWQYFFFGSHICERTKANVESLIKFPG